MYMYICMCLAGYYYPTIHVWACPLKGHVPIWRTAVVDCHRHSPQASKWVCVGALPSCVVYHTPSTTQPLLLPPLYPSQPSPMLVVSSTTCSFPRVTLNKRFLLAAPCCHAPYTSLPPLLPLHFIKTKSTKQKSQMQCWLYHLGPRRKRNKTSENATL